MILQCEACDTRYLVPDAALTPEGRTVRCARCGHMWFAEPPESLPDLSAFETARPKLRPLPKGSNVPAVTAPRHPLWAVAACILLLLTAAAIATLTWRPSLATLEPSEGLALADLSFSKAPGQRRESFRVQGTIANRSEHTKRLPVLRITLRDESGEPLQYWDFTGDRVIEAGKSVPFDTDQLESIFSKGMEITVEIGSPLELTFRQ